MDLQSLLRRLQLEYGAEIGRAVVNCKSRLSLWSSGRYHGGHMLVFSKALNQTSPLWQSKALLPLSLVVPAAAVVFPRKVRQLVATDERLATLET